MWMGSFRTLLTVDGALPDTAGSTRASSFEEEPLVTKLGHATSAGRAHMAISLKHLFLATALEILQPY